MTHRERMLSGEFFDVRDRELSDLRMRCRKLLSEFNGTPYSDMDRRRSILTELFRSETNVYIDTPLHCDYGINITLGKNCYINTGCVILDGAPVTIGNRCLFGPYVQLLAVGHGIHPDDRKTSYQVGKPIVIGNNVWLGASVIVMGGVTIGDGSIIGAGSVVTGDIPENVIAVGNPCRVLREITESDRAPLPPEAYDIEAFRKIF